MKGKISIPGHSGELDVSDKDLSAFEHFFSFITPGGIKDGVGIWNDNMRFKRWKNSLRITREAEEIREKYNLTTSPLPLKLEAGFIDAASLEEDPTLQTMWANLLANTTSSKIPPDFSYISTLKELSPIEAKILNKFYSVITAQDRAYLVYPSLSKYLLIDLIKKENENPEKVFDNLLRLRLLKQPAKRPARLPMVLNSNLMLRQTSIGTYDGRNKAAEEIVRYLKADESNIKSVENMLQLTALGYSLLIACNSPLGD